MGWATVSSHHTKAPRATTASPISDGDGGRVEPAEALSPVEGDLKRPDARHEETEPQAVKGARGLPPARRLRRVPEEGAPERERDRAER